MPTDPESILKSINPTREEADAISLAARAATGAMSRVFQQLLPGHFANRPERVAELFSASIAMLLSISEETRDAMQLR